MGKDGAKNKCFLYFLKLFFRRFSSRLFKFSILLRRPWAWARGDRARASARGLRRRMENVFFLSQHVFFKPYGPKKSKNLSFVYHFFDPFFKIFGP